MFPVNSQLASTEGGEARGKAPAAVPVDKKVAKNTLARRKHMAARKLLTEQLMDAPSAGGKVEKVLRGYLFFLDKNE